MADVAAHLREPSPFALMAMASGIIEATTPRPPDDWLGSERELGDGPSIYLAFADSGWPSMAALALAIATMVPDDVLAQRIRGAVDPAVVSSGPPWLASMGSIEITGAWLQTDVLGDGENVVVSWRWRGGGAATAFVYVDHNMGTLVKDAFVIPDEGQRLMAEYSVMQDESVTTVPLDPAATRARIVEAIESGERTVPPFETDSWPASRPMVEWVVRHLPEGGVGYERPEWLEADSERLLDDFISSQHGAVPGLRPEQVRDLADPLVWFASAYGPGDPLRWSPVSVEIVLADWYPRKVMGLPDDELVRLPDVLAGFVRFAHETTSIPRQLTDETMDAVERWRPAFLDAIQRRDTTPVTNAMRLARIAAGFDADEYDDEYDDDEGWFVDDRDSWSGLSDEEFTARALQTVESDLVAMAGGVDAYEALTDDPLGEIEFDWTGVPSAVRQPTADTLLLLDTWATELFDDEVRTIARGVLAGVVAVDPAVFNRSPRTDALAAAILAYLLNRLTGRMGRKERRQMPWQVFTQKELAAATGVSASSLSSRSRTVANVVDRADLDWPTLLHSTQRREMLEIKQRLADWHASEQRNA